MTKHQKFAIMVIGTIVTLVVTGVSESAVLPVISCAFLFFISLADAKE